MCGVLLTCLMMWGSNWPSMGVAPASPVPSTMSPLLKRKRSLPCAEDARRTQVQHVRSASGVNLAMEAAALAFFERRRALPGRGRRPRGAGRKQAHRDSLLRCRAHADAHSATSAHLSGALCSRLYQVPASCFSWQLPPHRVVEQHLGCLYRAPCAEQEQLRKQRGARRKLPRWHSTSTSSLSEEFLVSNTLLRRQKPLRVVFARGVQKKKFWSSATPA